MSESVDPVPILDALVRIRSHETEREVAGLLAERLERLASRGVRVTMTETPGAGGGHPNVRAEWGEGVRSIILNSHMDTVPPGTEWASDPFVPVLKDDRMIALGSADAKGCLASMLAAFENVVAAHRPDAGRLIYSAVSMEEGSGRGSEAEVLSGLRADAVIVGEPTDLEVCVAHKGVLRLRVTVTGKAAHASEPWEGENAINGMHPVLGELQSLAARVATRSEEPVGRASLAVTTITGGTALNVIPARCSIVLDRRLLPSESTAAARAEIDLAVRSALSCAGARGRIEDIVLADAASTPEDSEIVRTVLASLDRVSGRTHRARGFSATCDMYLFARRGAMPTVILGPGSLGQAHHAGESIALGELRSAAGLYTDVVSRWFGVDRA